MGNSASRQPSRATGKVILWDGSVQELDCTSALTAAELMLEHPRQVVAELRSAVTASKRLRPLPADEKLDTSKVYLMLPMKRGKPVSLSTEEARRVLLIASSALRSGDSSEFLSYSGFFPLLSRVCTAGAGVVGDERYHPHIALKKKGDRERSTEEKEEKAVPAVGQGRWIPEFDLPEELEGRPEYLCQQRPGKGWRPSLDTIVEKEIENRVTHWLF